MRIFADLHIHSKYSRSCSPDLTLENIAKWCEYKGIKVVGTADFTHPAWFNEIKSKLIEDQAGLYKLKDVSSPVRFILSSEISCIYKQGGRARRLHLCLLFPDLRSVESLNDIFDERGFNRKSDGRPIIGLSAKDLAKIALGINENSLVIPAHAWTPWFSVFGSKSGFDSLSECFEELTPKIHSIETGLSSDPPMNWQLSALDDITLISNSDAHSPANLGREANVFEISENNLNYSELSRIIKEKDRNKFLYTIEFFPEEGKYHIDGHADCKFSSLPQSSAKNKNICPRCGKKLVLGVLNRVSELADKKDNSARNQIPYKSTIPLMEIIADAYDVGKNSKKVAKEYFNLIGKYTEFEILLDLPLPELLKITDEEIANRVILMREGKVDITPGYDGIYGKVKIVKNKPKIEQKSLF